MMDHSASENQASAGAPRNWAWRVASALLLLLLVLAGAEAAVRVEDRIRWGMPLLSADTSTADLAISDRTGHHPAPGRVFHKWRINAVGTRGPEPDPARAGARALILGASETFGLYENADKEYARQLADTLAVAGCGADVLNGGFPGMSLPTVEQDFRLRLAALNPRVVVYYPTPVQYLDDMVPRAVRIDSNITVAPPALWHSRFRLRARDAFKAMLPRSLQDLVRRGQISQSRTDLPADSIFPAMPVDRLDAFDRDLRRLVGTIRAHGAIPILATHANAFVGTPPAAADRLRTWEKFYRRATGNTLVAFDSAAGESIRRIAADSAITLVDPWRSFHGLPGETMFADFSHFTDAGAARMAAILAPAVKTAMGCR